MRERRKTGSYAVGRARREAIIDAATALFVTAGYSSTPMAQIAQDVGLTPRGLLHYFPTKKHLLLAVVARRFDFAVDVVAEVPETPDGLRPLRALAQLTTRFLQQPGLVELFVLMTAEAADRSSPAHALFSQRYEQAVDDLTRDFVHEVSNGLLRDDVDYAALARRCIAVCDGLQLQWVLTGGTLDLDRLLDEYVAEVAATIRPRSTA